jgi:hypothetical protein
MVWFDSELHSDHKKLRSGAISLLAYFGVRFSHIENLNELNISAVK